MAEERLQRRLAAILSADVVGYSRLMGIAEARTLARLNALRRELIDPAIAAHSGRIVKLMGDGALVEFASAVDAVTCAIEVQRQLREHDAVSTEGDPIRFRIGINVGDIIIEGDDILGDGVNIAARIEGIAEPGGISISEDAWRQVQGKVAANFVDAGEQSLKNIARPVRVYRLDLAQKTASASQAPRPTLALPDIPPRGASGLPAGCCGQASRTTPGWSWISVSSSLLEGYDEPEILRSSSLQFCLTGVEAGHTGSRARIPYGNKEVALKLGARYRSGGWYAPPGVDLSAFGERGWL
jgi:class 3 adenylate cyclase